MMHNINTKQEIQSSVSKVECYVCGKGLAEGHSISAKTSGPDNDSKRNE